MDHTDLNLFKKAMLKLGYKQLKGWVFQDSTGSTAELKNGRINISSYYGAKLDVDQLKRSYSTEVVKEAANTYGWQLEETSPGEFQAVKNY